MPVFCRGQTSFLCAWQTAFDFSASFLFWKLTLVIFESPADGLSNNHRLIDWMRQKHTARDSNSQNKNSPEHSTVGTHQRHSVDHSLASFPSQKLTLGQSDSPVDALSECCHLIDWMQQECAARDSNGQNKNLPEHSTVGTHKGHSAEHNLASFPSQKLTLGQLDSPVDNG